MDKDKLQEVEKNLNFIIEKCIFDIYSLPIRSELHSAAQAYKCIKLLDLKLSQPEEKILHILQRDNNYQEDFLGDNLKPDYSFCPCSLEDRQ